MLFLFPAFGLIWGVVGLVSIKCQVRSVPLAVLCWHGWPNAFAFCSDSLPTGHVCPLKFEILAVCVVFCISIPSLCNWPACWCCRNQTSVSARCLAEGSRQECASPLSLSSRALTNYSRFVKGVWVLRDAGCLAGVPRPTPQALVFLSLFNWSKSRGVRHNLMQKAGSAFSLKPMAGRQLTASENLAKYLKEHCWSQVLFPRELHTENLASQINAQI